MLCIIIAWLAVYTSIVSMFFHIFHVFIMFCTFFTSANVVEFSVLGCFFPKGVQLQLDGWPWKGEGEKVRWEPKGVVWEQSVWVLPSNARFEC